MWIEESKLFEKSFSNFLNLDKVKRIMENKDFKSKYEIQFISKQTSSKIQSIQNSIDNLINQGVISNKGLFYYMSGNKDMDFANVYVEVTTIENYSGKANKSVINPLLEFLQRQNETLQIQSIIVFVIISGLITIIAIFISFTFSE